MAPWLTEDEMAVLTGYQQKARQRKALSRMGIAFRTRPDGYPLVERAAVIQYRETYYAAKPRRREPKFSVVN